MIQYEVFSNSHGYRYTIAGFPHNFEDAYLEAWDIDSTPGFHVIRVQNGTRSSFG